MYATPKEGSSSMELAGHLLDRNSDFAMPAIKAADKFRACIRYSKGRAAQFSKEGTDALHTWAQLSLTATEG